MWTMRVVVFYILTFVFTIVLGGIQEAARNVSTTLRQLRLEFSVRM
jgi:hypothetical protein